MNGGLIVALHGVGSSAQALALTLTTLSSRAEIIALDGPEAFPSSATGRQWFSRTGITEANRPERVAAALPPLLDRLDAIAAGHGVDRHALILLGFSQGAIVTLAAVAGGHFHGRAIAIAGRLAAPVVPDVEPARVLLVHDRDDSIMPLAYSIDAGAALGRAGHRIDGLWTAGLGHRIGGPMLPTIDRWLSGQSLSASA